MNQEFIIAYNDSGLNISSVVDYYRYLFSDQCTVYDTLSLKQIPDLKSFISKFKDSKDKAPRILFIFDVNEKDFTEIIQKLNEIGLNQYRVNYLLTNVAFSEQVLAKLHKLNSFLKGNVGFIYLIGTEDFEGNKLSDEKIRELVFNFLFLMTNGSFTHRTGQDPFFWQQNSRSEENHVMVLNPIHFTTGLSGDIYHKLFEETVRETQLWYDEKTTKKVDVFDSVYSSLVYSKDEGPFPLGVFKHNIIPCNRLLEDAGDENLLIMNISKFIGSAEDVIKDYKLRSIDEKKNILYNKKDFEIKKLLERGRENTTSKYLNQDKFEISKLHITIEGFLESCSSFLYNRFNKIPVFEPSEILNSVKSYHFPILVERAKRIKSWKSRKNKMRLFLNGLILAGLLGAILFYLIYYKFEAINFKDGLIISVLASVFIVGFISIQYFFKKLRQFIRQYEKKHNEIIGIINQQIKDKFYKFEEGWFNLILEIYKKKVIKNLYFYLVRLKNTLQSFEEIVAFWISQRKKLSEINENATYLCKFKQKRDFEIKKDVENMLLVVKKDLGPYFNSSKKIGDNFFINVFDSLDFNFFESHKKILKKFSVQTKIMKTDTEKDIGTKVSSKIYINKLNRIPLNKKFLISLEHTSPKIKHSFILKSNNDFFSDISLQESFDDIIELNGVEPNLTVGYVFNVALKKI